MGLHPIWNKAKAARPYQHHLSSLIPVLVTGSSQPKSLG
jgi:hypothetical protein